MILRTIEPFLEVSNLVLALVILFLGIGILSHLKGNLKSSWVKFFIAISLFGIHEVFGTLSKFNIFEISGLYTLSETLFIVALLVSIISFKKLFDNLGGQA